MAGAKPDIHYHNQPGFQALAGIGPMLAELLKARRVARQRKARYKTLVAARQQRQPVEPTATERAVVPTNAAAPARRNT